MFNLTACAKCISVTYEEVEVTVVNKYHRDMWLQPIRINNHTSFITHPEVWEITIDYNGVEYVINGSDTYNKYEDKIGQIVVGKLEIRTYEDGNVKYKIVSLK